MTRGRRGPGLNVSLSLAMGIGLVLGLGLGACDSKPTPTFTHALRLGGVEVPVTTLEQGQKLYGRYCASCHGALGDGKGAAGAALAQPPRDFRSCKFAHAQHAPGKLPSHDEVLEIIKKGVTQKGMPAWKGLNPQDLEAVGRYVETFCEDWQAPKEPN